MYEERFYRKDFANAWNSYEISIEETDILIKTEVPIDQERIRSLIIELREQVKEQIQEAPDFLSSLRPVPGKESAKPIIKEMIHKSAVVGTGPMSSVAGAIAEFVGRELMQFGGQFVVENGGDICIKKNGGIILGIYAGLDNPVNDFLLQINKTGKMLGVCSSSSRLGHSLSLGYADLVTVISESAVFADALATGIANRVCTDADVSRQIDKAKNYRLVKGLVIVKGNTIGLWGDITLAHK